jgi:BolA protein
MLQVWSRDNPFQELKIIAMGAIFEAIHHKLTSAFTPIRLEIEDDSARHEGHAGSRPGGDSHFNVVIESQAFAGVPRVARQRLVYQALAEELAGPLHALSVKALAPGEG